MIIGRPTRIAPCLARHCPRGLKPIHMITIDGDLNDKVHSSHMAESDPDVPSKKDLLLPILRVLSNGVILTVDELVDAVVTEMGLPRSVLSRKATNKEKPEFKNRLEWACTDLRKRGLIDFPETKVRKTANRRITALGRQVLQEGKDPEKMPEIVDVGDRTDGWYPAMYTPGLSKEDWLGLLRDPMVFNERSLDLMFKMMSFDGKATCKQLSQRFGGSPQGYNSVAIQLARRIHEKTGCPLDVADSGADRYWSILFLGKDAPEDVPGTYMWRLRPELVSALSEIELEPVDGDVRPPVESFFDYLESRGLMFETEAVENFLLSIKAKQFAILSGGTGTGKTKLAQAYGEFFSSNGHNREMRTEVTLGKVAENNGFTLSREDFFSVFPEAAQGDGYYQYRIGDCEGTGEIKMTPRFWFPRDEHRAELMNRLEEMKKDGEKAELVLVVPGKGSEGKHYEIVPVGSNWTDNRHILGYRNAISGGYVRTPSLDLMLAADQDKVHTYMLVLDEMNLSHVERYLSDIISCMESGESVKLDSDGSIPESLALGDNLIVIGTVNMDETTYTFSPKVLDRANVLEFDATSVSDYLSGSGTVYYPSGDVAYLQDSTAGLECRHMSAREIIAEMRALVSDGIINEMVRDLGETQIRMSGMGLPFAYRTLDEVMRFMYVAWNYTGRGDFLDWKRYFDAQIRQKILPKIHGNSSILSELRAFRDMCAREGYVRSEQRIAHMTYVLESQRYVSFNS